MPTKSRQFKPKRSFINGVDTTTPLESPDIANTLSECLNGEMIDQDIIRTRNGYQSYTTAKAGYIVSNGIEYTKSDGVKETIIYLVSTTKTGTSGILCREVNGTLVNITTGLPDTYKPCMVQAGVLLFVFNGVEDFVYDGISTRQIGIDAPEVAPQIKQLIKGSLNDEGFYIFTYRYRNSITGARSSPSLPSATITSGKSSKNQSGIRIRVTPGDPETADKIDIFRSVSGGTIFFYDGTVDIDKTTYDSVLSDTALGDQLELDDSRLPEAARFAVLSENRLFVGGFESNKGRIQHSKIGKDGPLYESFQIADLIDCNITDGSPLVGLGIVGGKVGVLKHNKFGRLIPVDLSFGGLETGGSSKFVYREIDDPCTALNHFSIFSIEGNMGWMGTDNIYMSDGYVVKPIANRIRNTIRTFNFTESDKFYAYRYGQESQVIFGCVRSGVTVSDYQLVAHYKNTPIIGFTMFSPGIDASTHPGIRASAIWDITLSNQKQPVLGTNDGNALICRYNYGSNDNGNPIYFSVKDQWEPGIDAMAKKSFHSIRYLAFTNAKDTFNYLNNTWEEDGREFAVKTEKQIIFTATKWGTEKWGTFKWSGRKYTNVSFFPNRKAYLGRFGVWNDELNAQFYIKSARIMYRLLQE